jgi:hypothetical protein
MAIARQIDMDNPILDVIRQYDMVRLSAVIVSLAAEGGLLELDIRRQGGSRGHEACTSAPDGISLTVYSCNPPMIRIIEGEYYSHEADAWVRACARHAEAYDVLRVRDGAQTRWHFRPCRNWRIVKSGGRFARILPAQKMK